MLVASVVDLELFTETTERKLHPKHDGSRSLSYNELLISIIVLFLLRETSGTQLAHDRPTFDIVPP